MSLDYGSVTVGVAMTDALGLTAQPRETITRKKENHLRRTLARLEQLLKENQVERIVLGRPVTMDGSDGERVRQTEIFREALAARTGIPIVWQDERLTTVAADEVLEEMGIPREERKQHIDAIAAAIILQDYMNVLEQEKLHGKGNNEPDCDKR